MEIINRAAELGYESEQEFLNDTFARFFWRWTGYVRRAERQSENITRNLGSILINANRSKNTPVYKPLRDYPLSIDFINDDYSPTFTIEDAQKVLDKVKNAGWLN